MFLVDQFIGSAVDWIGGARRSLPFLAYRRLRFFRKGRRYLGVNVRVRMKCYESVSVSYTHLDVYKRQQYDYANTFTLNYPN